MIMIPKIGDVLVVKAQIFTGADDFTQHIWLDRGDLCVVLYACQKDDLRPVCLGGVTPNTTILILLFTHGVIEWKERWQSWSDYLEISK